MPSTFAQIAHIADDTQAEGPGRRMAIWFQGCPLRCAECCNPEMLPFEGGQAIALESLGERMTKAKAMHAIEGITLLGGEPFAHAAAAVALARFAQASGLSVMVFSGYTLEDLQVRGDAIIDALLDATDILVDGPYLRELPDRARRWIGSTNQRIHFLSSRYRADDPIWQAPNTLEIRWQDGELAINGFPSPGTKRLWQRPATSSPGELGRRRNS
jgi:anaerobic ribonucleoside-triphosphate reductase activating protein